MPGMRTILAALLAATLPLTAAAGEAQLLPFGKFAARDGRPGNGKQWEVTDAQGLKLAEQINAVAAKTPIVIDYEHQTLLSEKNGQPAPAAGWVHSVEWRTGQGLFATVEWTERAKAHIQAKEYLYISPVINYDATGKVLGVLNAALVNYPALLGMEPVVAQLGAQFHTTQPEPAQMDLAALIALFGLAAATTPDQLTAFLTGLKVQVDELATLKTKLGLDAKVDMAGVIAQVETLKAAGGKPDSATLQMVTALQGQVAALTTQLTNKELTELVDGALKAGKLLPAQKDWATELGKKDLAQLKSFLESAPVVAAGLQNSQSGGNDPAKNQNGDLSPEQLAVCKAMGMTPDEFKKGAVTAG